MRKDAKLSDYPDLTNEEVLGFLRTCEKSPHTNLVWGNAILGRLCFEVAHARGLLSPTPAWLNHVGKALPR